jgi:uncharacterized membrane protein YcaP (DUF421 family)
LYIVMIRTIILYSVVVVTMRIMGKRQIGQLQPFELVIAIMISELASLPMQDTRIPLMHGIIPIITLLILQVILSITQLKSEKARTLICGMPSILIRNGIIDIAQLKSQRFNINDLMEEMRLQGYYNLEDIEYAILETSGQLSIIPKTGLSQVTKIDMNIPYSQDKLPITLIMDGKINIHNLKIANKDINWLNEQLISNNISSSKEVFIAIIDSQDKFYLQPKNKGSGQN